MTGVLDAWLDLLHGTSCAGCARPGRSLCPSCVAALPTSAGPVSPDPRPSGLAPCSAAGEYAGVLRAVLLAHKEHAVHDLRRPLAEVLAVAVEPVLAPGVVTVLVPVPSSPGVVRRRGHDPLVRVTRTAARRLRRTGGREVVALGLLQQRGVVADQAGLDVAARRANRVGSLRLRAGARRRLVALVGGRPVVVVVVDDVLTTGATVREAQRALEAGGVPVRGVAVLAATRRRVAAAGRRTLPVVGPPH